MYRQVDRRNEEPFPRGGTSLSHAEPVEYLEAPAAERVAGTARRASGGLPRPSTELIGRETELAALIELLSSSAARPLTITGTGGVGKTRLGIEAAARSLDRYPDGVHFVSLAPVRAANQVLPAIARSLGIHRSGGADIFDTLIVTLHEQRILLLLDNFEQVIDAAPEIGELIAACPLLSVLITSRAPLRIGSERIFHTAPLAFGSAMSSPEAYPSAIRLFADRGSQVNSAFELDERNLETVREICHRLDGLPLAIELAAARLRTISPRELLNRLDPRLPILSTAFRDLPERQQTMRATIAWSYELLTDRERQLFRWLSVFVGGFRLAGARAVASTMGDAAVAEADLVDGIDALISGSLLVRVPGPSQESRYAMLEVVREYGLELLEQHAELDRALSAHVAHYATNRRWLDPNRFGPDERLIDHLWDIDADYPNVRVALATCDATEDYRRMLDIAGSVAVFCHHRGLLGESRFWLERALEGAVDAEPEARCWGLAGLGLVRWTQSDHLGAEPVLLEALKLADELGHVELRALSLHMLALVDLEQREPMRARDRIEEALALWRELELPSDEGMALHILSWIPARPGEPDARMGDALSCLALFESLGHTSGIGYALQRLGRLAQQAGDERGAFDFYARATTTWLGIDERWAINRALVMVVSLATQHRQFDLAAQLVGVIDNRRRLSDTALSSEYQSVFDDACRATETALGPTQFEMKRRAGSKLELDAIDALVANLGTRLYARPLLSQRETEVLQRVAAGETDREIADALFLSPRTVHTHVSHILTKLDVSTRRAAVKRAEGLGILPSR